MSYAEKLRDPRWQKKRLQIFERDGWRCVICHRDNQNLQVHHAVYAKRAPWEYPDHVLQTLCESCHAERQELTDKAVDALRIALMKIPTQRLLIVSEHLCKEAFGEICL